jgi:hypothetical protein
VLRYRHDYSKGKDMPSLQSQVAPKKGRPPGPLSTLPIPILEQAAYERFESQYEIDPSGCWLWTKNRLPNGYGRFSYQHQWYIAHRVSYTIHKGPIPGILDLDHLCRVRHCVNPDHLEAVTRRENLLRGIGATAIHAAKTHCVNGHEFTEANIYRAPKEPRVRACRACRAIVSKNRRRS